MENNLKGGRVIVATPPPSSPEREMIDEAVRQAKHNKISEQ